MRARVRQVAVGASVCAALLAAVPAVAPARELRIDGQKCERIAVRTASPFGAGPCPGVRPGALLEIREPGGELFGYCTQAFLFKGRKKHRYLATAGHCAIPERQEGAERLWGRGDAPFAVDGEGNRIGRFVYAVLKGEHDFALVRLRRGVAASPQMCHFGGPTGINRDRTSRTVVLHQYGNGIVAGDLLPARTELAFGTPNPDHVYSTGVATLGDSGGPVTSADGRAVGVLVTTGVHAGGFGSDGIDAGLVGITRIGPHLDRAAEQLGTRLKPLLAPLN